MRRASIIVIAIAIGAPAAADPSLRGVLLFGGPGHCGGAYMPDYKMPPPAPKAGTKLLLRKGDKNSERKPAAEVTTAADGSFDADLPAGTYCVVLDGKRTKPRKGGRWADLKCLVADWQQCDAVVKAPVDKPVEITIWLRCFGPCYHGPLPP